jgi:hypothetical protein
MTLRIREQGLSVRTALSSICEAERLELAQWLTATFNLTAEDARWDDNCAPGCANGHLTVTQWLVATFGLTAEDARSLDNLPLHSSCANGHLRWCSSKWYRRLASRQRTLARSLSSPSRCGALAGRISLVSEGHRAREVCMCVCLRRNCDDLHRLVVCDAAVVVVVFFCCCCC